MPSELERAFAEHRLVRPSDAKPNLVHLVRALAALAGATADDVELSPPVRELMDVIGPAEHLVFVLLDGLGMNVVRRMPPTSFLASHLKREIHATCPSTTACALTSVTTGHYPNRHGVAGWFTHLPQFGLTATVLPFVERFSGQPLGERGVRVEDVLPLPPVCTKMATHRPLTMVPSYIANTTYNTYSRGGTSGRGYTTTSNAIELLIDDLERAEHPTYTYLYLHDIDTLCHHVGVDSPDVLPLVQHIDAELRRLSESLAGKARIVVSADHGLIDVPKEQQALLMDGDPLLDLLVVPPSGDARMPVFHVREGRRAPFVERFTSRFADRMALVETDDAERMGLFGPGTMSPVARLRFGDFVAFPFRPATLAYHPANKPLGHLYLAVHAGLSPEEMWVPLCVA